MSSASTARWPRSRPSRASGCDFPHPTCIYPVGVELARRSLAALDPDVVSALMGGNAARLYRLRHDSLRQN